jgi:adenosylhomocysteinase
MPVSTSDIADPSLAPAGRARIEWADAQMPVLRSIRARLADERPLDGIAVAACLHVTAETANLVRALIAGGAEVALCAANPLSTQDETAAALAEDFGAEVHARHGEDAEAYAAHVAACARRRPHVTLDDGADLVMLMHHARARVRERLIGGTEETTTGLLRVRALEAEGRLTCPVIAVNEAHAERIFNDHYGTGQSALSPSARAAPARRSSSARSIPCAPWRRGWRASRSCPRWRRQCAATSSSRSPARGRSCAASTSSA